MTVSVTSPTKVKQIQANSAIYFPGEMMYNKDNELLKKGRSWQVL
jgi:hypothetical protein